MNWNDIFSDIENRKKYGLEVLPYPHPVLLRKSIEIKNITPEFKKLSEIMFEIMYSWKGMGLAMSQIGLPWRMFVLNATGNKEDKKKEMVFLNPVLKANLPMRTKKEQEGCLSLPGLYKEIERPHTIQIEATNLEGKPFKTQMSGLTSRVIQHEFDHLEGILFIDRLNEKERKEITGFLNYISYQFEQYQGFKQLKSIEEINKDLENLENFNQN